MHRRRLTCCLVLSLDYPGVITVMNLTELSPKVPIVLGTQDGTGQGSHWLIECPVILIAHI